MNNTVPSLLNSAALFFLAIISFYFFTSCSETKSADHVNYMHLAHIRIFDTINQVVDPRVEQLDFSKYDMLLLGGDLTEESSESKETLVYLDSLFNLGSPNTLWALGNHDNAQLDWVEETTGRPYSFTHHHNGITYLILYTQEKEDWICTITGEQLEMLKSVTDTISASSHLVVMTHKLIWIMNHPELAEHQGETYYDWSCNYRIHKNGWMTDILPRLQAVQKRGVQVIALAGDIGNNVDEFEEQTSDGIYYLASGSNPENKKAKFLLFEHDVKNRDLRWRFVKIGDQLRKDKKNKQ